MINHVQRLILLTIGVAALTSAGTALGADPTPVITNGAPLFGDTGVVLTGRINPNDLTGGFYHAECGPDTTYGTTTPAVPAPSSSPFDVQINIGAYPVGTVLHCRIVGQWGGYAPVGPDLQLTVIAPTAPVIAPLTGDYGVSIGGDPGDEFFILANVHGGGRPTTGRVACGTGGTYPIQLPSRLLSPASGDVEFSLWSPLLPYAATYTCVVRATNDRGTAQSEPVVIELPARGARLFTEEEWRLVDNSYIIDGWLDPAGSAATHTITCVSRFNTRSVSVTKAVGATNLTFSLNLGPFDRNELYECISTLTNASHESNWNFQISLPLIAPVVTTRAITFTDRTMTVQGRIHTGGLTTIARAHCGTTPGAYTRSSPELVMPYATATNTVSLKVSGLSYLTRYYCRVTAVNDQGTTHGLPLTIVSAPAIGPVSARDSTVTPGTKVVLRARLGTRSYVTTSVFRRVPGRVSGGKCRAGAMAGTRCTALVYRGKVRVLRLKGTATWAVPTHSAGKQLAPGSYTAKVQSTDPTTGRVTGVRSVNFRVLG